MARPIKLMAPTFMRPLVSQMAPPPPSTPRLSPNRAFPSRGTASCPPPLPRAMVRAYTFPIPAPAGSFWPSYRMKAKKEYQDTSSINVSNKSLNCTYRKCIIPKMAAAVITAAVKLNFSLILREILTMNGIIVNDSLIT